MSIVRFYRNRSLILTSSVIISILFVVVVGSLVTISYRTQKSTETEQMQAIGSTLASQMNANSALINNASMFLSTNKTGDAVFTTLRRLFDGIVTDPDIMNSYIMLPDIATTDGKSYLKTLQTDSGLAKAGVVPGSDYEMSAVFQQTYTEAINNGYAMSDPYSDDYGTWITYLGTIKNNSGKPIGLFGIDFDYGAMQKRMLQAMWQSIAIGGGIGIVAIVLVCLFMMQTLKPLRRLAAVAGQAAGGDLTVSVQVNGSNEVGRASQAFNQMLSGLRSLVQQIQSTSSEVSQAALDLQMSSEQTSRATQEIAKSVQAVSAGSETQLQSSQECQRSMSEMALGIQRIAESSSVVSELAADTSRRASDGESVILSTVTQMQSIERNVSTTVGSMQNVAELSSQINDILVMISDVAKRTNLLALNASIEAARAGEHGRGFAVVATEIRKLAESSRVSSEQITEMLQNADASIQQSVGALTATMTEVRSGSVVAERAGETFRSIVESIRKVTAQVQEVSAASEEMSASSEEIAASLEELERIAANATDQTAQVAAASQEQLATIEEVAGSSTHLRELADGLREEIGRFRL
ncbi:methyl-accepting chemotaxis protein [Cohnella lubricantis]|uniref:Methyl-accepting chemotaxis protein n=1 Tax=Cohnella lubricantis TaxID=2163172 RepID=A0A841TIE6_9BACL|nr:methyl-accepting chemotaxis protein [Cohnella lubricantis]MBB6679000.1 methyl-accepting chemotaxis protein [Cohnella lubricantis]MBP2119512.1 methyl-accepting chemotaxis protein [Cohnella lubricantis]